MADNQCTLLLKDGVYAKHITTQTADKTVDYKMYFQSEKFRSDYKEGNVNVSVGIVASGIPINLGYGATDTEITEFQEKIKNSVDLTITEKFYFNNAETFADKNLLEAYNECLRISNQLGFNIRYEQTSNEISFIVKYINFGALANPILESVYFSTNTAPKKRELNDHEALEVVSEYRFTYDLGPNLKDGIFIIETNLGSQSLKVDFRKRGVYEDSSPVGTIISSFIDWDTFQQITACNKETNGIWQSKFSIWSPCDGRMVPNSFLSEKASLTNVPDLRGVFLRGLNVIDALGESKGKISKVDPAHKDIDEGRTVGSFQQQDIQSHTHTYFAPTTSSPIRGSGGYAPENPGTGTTGSTGGAETRPKNVSIYYYIKIN